MENEPHIPNIQILDINNLKKQEIASRGEAFLPVLEGVSVPVRKKRSVVETMYSELLTEEVSRILIVENDKLKPSCLIIDRKGLEYRSKNDGELHVMTYNAETKEVSVDNRTLKDKGMSIVLKILKSALHSVETNKAKVLKELVTHP